MAEVVLGGLHGFIIVGVLLSARAYDRTRDPAWITTATVLAFIAVVLPVWWFSR